MTAEYPSTIRDSQFGRRACPPLSRSMPRSFCSCSLALVLLSSSHCAQVAPPPKPGSETFGALAGRVVDASTHAPVEYVIVMALPTDGQEYTTAVAVTESLGAYRIPSLPAGRYTVRCEIERYEAYERKDVMIDVARTAVVDVELVPDPTGSLER